MVARVPKIVHGKISLARCIHCGTVGFVLTLPDQRLYTVQNMCVYIQGDSGGICNTLRNESMCDSKQKSSYKYVSDFRWLRSYGHFLIPVHALM
jgi:hypothetical protein